MGDLIAQTEALLRRVGEAKDKQGNAESSLKLSQEDGSEEDGDGDYRLQCDVNGCTIVPLTSGSARQRHSIIP